MKTVTGWCLRFLFSFSWGQFVLVTSLVCKQVVRNDNHKQHMVQKGTLVLDMLVVWQMFTGKCVCHAQIAS